MIQNALFYFTHVTFFSTFILTYKRAGKHLKA